MCAGGSSLSSFWVMSAQLGWECVCVAPSVTIVFVVVVVGSLALVGHFVSKKNTREARPSKGPFEHASSPWLEATLQNKTAQINRTCLFGGFSSMVRARCRFLCSRWLDGLFLARFVRSRRSSVPGGSCPAVWSGRQTEASLRKHPRGATVTGQDSRPRRPAEGLGGNP